MLTEIQQGESDADDVLNRPAVREPGVRQPRAGTGAGNVVKVVRFVARPGLRAHERRRCIRVAQLDAGHFVGPALRNARQLRHLRARGGAIGSLLTDVRPKCAAPYMKTGGCEPGRITIASAYRFALALIRSQQGRSTPPLHRAGELPREIDCVPYASVHAQPAGGNYKMSGIARDERPAAAVAFGHQQVQGPLVDVQNLDLDAASGKAADGLSAAVTTDQVACADGRRAVGPRNPKVDAVLPILE